MVSPSLPILSALGQPTRWRIFELLLTKGAVGMLQREIGEALDVPKPLLSAHLKVLQKAGLVNGERSGREVTYRVTPELARNAAEIMLDAIKAAPDKPA